MKRTVKVLILVPIVSVALGSCKFDPRCFFDYKSFAGIYVGNCTNDTLLIELSASDTLVGGMYWDKQSGNTIVIDPEYNKVVNIHGEIEIILNSCYALPGDSLCVGDSCMLGLYDTCYVYAIKWHVATHYTLEEIRAKKLYDRRSVTSIDFNENRLFEYRTTDFSGNN